MFCTFDLNMYSRVDLLSFDLISLLCFSSVYIVGSRASKLRWITFSCAIYGWCVCMISLKHLSFPWTRYCQAFTCIVNTLVSHTMAIPISQQILTWNLLHMFPDAAGSQKKLCIPFSSTDLFWCTCRFIQALANILDICLTCNYVQPNTGKYAVICREQRWSFSGFGVTEVQLLQSLNGLVEGVP